MLFESFSLSSSRHHLKIIGDILKIVERISASDVIRLMAMKMRLKMTNRSQRYDINRPRHILGPKYSKCKMLSIMMVICIKRHLSNI